MTSIENDAAWPDHKPTALLVLADGTVLEGFGLGAEGHAVGEVCFNTAMTGYEEILTDPSYAGQIITFTFPHIGNVGTNEHDIETVNLAATPGARGVVLHTAITAPSNYRATRHLDQWLGSRGVIGLAGIDTRALTALIREKGMPNAVIAHEPSGRFDLDVLKAEARQWPGLVGMDLVPTVTTAQRFTWNETPWQWDKGAYGELGRPDRVEQHREHARYRLQVHGAVPGGRFEDGLRIAVGFGRQHRHASADRGADWGGGRVRRCALSYGARRTTTQFWPPKPNALAAAVRTVALRALSGT